MIIRYDQECHFIFNRTHAKRLKVCPAADTSYSRGCLLRYACLSHFMHNTNNKYAIIITHRLAAECAIKSKTHVPSSLQQSTTFSNILRLIPPCVRGIRVARCHLHTTRREKRMHRKSVSFMFYIFWLCASRLVAVRTRCARSNRSLSCFMVDFPGMCVDCIRADRTS